MQNEGGTETITQIGMTRQNLFKSALDKVQENNKIGTQTSLDRDGYMTDLKGLKINSETEINDYKKARALLKAIITSNPKSTSGWIAAARVEELDGKIQEARNILAQACQNFLDNEDVWLEAARLTPPDKVKAFLAKAVQNMPTSKRLWQQAAISENDLKLRAKIYRRALEQLPREVDLWKECVKLEQPDEAKQLLAKAVQCVPHTVDLWLALAKLETYKNAQGVLQKAREANPTELRIYIAAAKLEEAQGNKQIISKIVKRALNNFRKHQVELSRDQWLQQAVLAEQADSLQTCKAIIKETMDFGLNLDSFMDDKEKKKQTRQTWLENVDACVQQGAIETAKAIIINAIALDSSKKSLWMRAQQLEQEYGTTESLCQLL